MFIFMYRLLINLIKFIFVTFPLQLVGSILLLGYLPYHRKKVIESIQLNAVIGTYLQLPYLLRWFDNADIYPEFNREYYKYSTIFVSSFWTHYFWLAWRNPINYFSYKHLSFFITDKYEVLKFIGDQNIGDKDKNGKYLIEIKQDGKIYYEYYAILKYTQSKCLRFRMGWKILPKHKEEFVQNVFVVSPFKSYTGI